MNLATHSTCRVRGKRSTGCTSTARYPCSVSQRESRAAVAALQLTITTVRGAICSMASSVAVSQPLRGGSTTITSGRVPSAASRAAAAPASSQRKSARSRGSPSRAAVALAPSTACGTISTPNRRRQSGSMESPIVPIPQYRSSKKSSGCKPA